ncbi:MAG: helix-turn-helix domain-containing protein [Bacteroidia bacterium]
MKKRMPVKQKHRTFTGSNGSEKAKIALAALQERQTLSEIVQEYGVHPNQVSQWKKQALVVVSGFEDQRKSDRESKAQEDLVNDLHQQIGLLTVERDKFFDARFNFKLRALEELLGPIYLQLIRSKITLRGYQGNDAYREKILKQCNETIRGLLLEKGHLIPVELLPYAEQFISHYDEWLQHYHKTRETQDQTEVTHLFTHNFPHDAETAFRKKYEAYRKELGIEGSLGEAVSLSTQQEAAAVAEKKE